MILFFVISKINFLSAGNTNFAFVIGKIIFSTAKNDDLPVPIRKARNYQKFDEITSLLLGYKKTIKNRYQSFLIFGGFETVLGTLGLESTCIGTNPQQISRDR